LRSIGPRQQLIDIAVEMSEAEIRAYVIADNKLAENAGWDRLEKLASGEVAGVTVQSAQRLVENSSSNVCARPQAAPRIYRRKINKDGDNKIKLSAVFRWHRPKHNSNGTVRSGFAANLPSPSTR
jgi:hypothetical protein